MTLNTLFTAGYTGLTPDLILKAANRHDAFVADIRLSPHSRHPQWEGAALAAVLGDRYIHIRELGNRNFKGDYGEGVMLLDADRGSIRVLALLKHRPVILLCACKDWQHCHRLHAAQEMETRYGATVIHLTQNDFKRIDQPDLPHQEQLF